MRFLRLLFIRLAPLLIRRRRRRRRRLGRRRSSGEQLQPSSRF